MDRHGQHQSRIRWATLAFCLCLVAFAAPARAIELANDDDTVLTPATELAAALNLREDFLEQATLVEDAVLVEKIRRVGRRVAAQSDRPDLPYAFYVLESGERAADYQAISLPGGTIALTRALVELLADDEDPLAFALAHEVAHVALGHHLSGERLLHDGSKRVVRFTQRLQRHQELVADRYGALYLVRAGLRFTAGGDALRRIDGAVGKTAKDPGDHPSYRQRLKQLDGFRVELERSVAAFDRAAELLQEGEVEEALTALSIFVQQFPQSVAGRVNLGMTCLVRLAEKGGSPGGLDEPLTFMPESGIDIRGVYDGELLERARRNFLQALSVQPSNDDALLGLALVELRRGDTQASIRLLQRTGESDSAEFLLARGNASYLKGEHRLAAQIYNRALELKQKWPAARKNLALTYEALGRYDRAAELWLALIAEPRLEDQARWRLALLQQRDDHSPLMRSVR